MQPATVIRGARQNKWNLGRVVWVMDRGMSSEENQRILQRGCGHSILGEKLDGKYLLSTSDEHLSAEDIALGYKQLLGVERAFRTLKSTLCLRPVYHSKDDRIRSHVLICWLALLLVRIDEVETDLVWSRIRQLMQQLNSIEFFDNNGPILQHTELTANHPNILNKLKINPSQRILKVDLTP